MSIKYSKHFDRLVYGLKQPRNHPKPKNKSETTKQFHWSKSTILTKVKGKKPTFK